MLKIGLTGGIGSGKSTVCALFADLGVPIIDADVIARQLVEPGQVALAALVTCFGNSILNQDGSLNRALLRQKMLADSEVKRQLDAIMHPLVYQKIGSALESLPDEYCIIAIPLLVETRQTHLVDRILVIDCPLEVQMERVLARDNVSREQAAAIIAAQANRDQRLAVADDVIDNADSAAHLAEQVKTLHNLYLLFATARTTSA